MKSQIEELKTYLNRLETKNEAVSKATVGWLINHTLLVINGACLSLMRSKKDDYIKKFNLIKFFVFVFKKFPRGKGKSPARVNPKEEEISLEKTHKQLDTAQKLLEKINTLPPQSNFNHPIFGLLNLRESKKFLRIHTEHHLKIIGDILK